MELQITNHSQFQDLSCWEQGCNQALDTLWKEPWLTQSLSKQDQALLPDLQRLAQEMVQGCDHILVACEPSVGKAVTAALSLIEEGNGGPAVSVFPATLSPVDYDALFGRMAGQRVRLLAMACGPESLALRGTYAILKQYVFSQRNPLPSPVYAVVGQGSQAIAQDSGENDYPVAHLGDDAKNGSLGNSPALLLPLLLAGGDGEAYLEGFREMLADPGWDRDATLFAKGRAQAQAEKMPLQIRTWQRELEPMTRLLSSGGGCTGEWKSAAWMPEEEGDAHAAVQTTGAGPKALLVDLSLAEGPVDLMTPSFEGCHPDGSLTMLLQERMLRAAQEAGAMHISGARTGAKSAGAWMAFCQVSEGIVRNILSKQVFTIRWIVI